MIAHCLQCGKELSAPDDMIEDLGELLEPGTTCFDCAARDAEAAVLEADCVGLDEWTDDEP